MELNKSNIKKILLIITFTLMLMTLFQNYKVVLATLHSIFRILLPFIMGSIFAFLLNIPMSFYERVVFKGFLNKKSKKFISFSRPISLILAILSVVAVVSGVFTILIPELTTTITNLSITVYAFVPRAQIWAENTLNNYVSKNDIQAFFNDLDWQSIINYFTSLFRSSGNMLYSTFGVVQGIFSSLVNIVIGFVFAIYILLQKEKFNLQFKRAMLAIFGEKICITFFSVSNLIFNTFNKFVTGQCLEAIILGSMFFVALSVLRIPYALLVGVVIGFTALIPIVGAFIGCGISAFLILMVSPIKALIFIIVFAILQQIEGNLIYPQVVGSSIGLPSIWVLVAVSLGGSLFGIMGMLIFIPITSVIYTLFQDWMRKRISIRDIKI